VTDYRISDVKCVAFDFGGTLATGTSAPELCEVVARWRSQYGQSDTGFEARLAQAFVESRQAYKNTGATISLNTMLRASLGSVSFDQQIGVDAFVEDLWRNTQDGRIYPDVTFVLEQLNVAGFSLMLACNTRRPGQFRRKTLEESGILKYFSGMVISSELGYGKPSTKFYRAVERVAADLGCDVHETLFVGDSLERDVLGPLRYGMQAVWVTEATNTLHEQVPVVSHIRLLPNLFLGQS